MKSEIDKIYLTLYNAVKELNWKSNLDNFKGHLSDFIFFLIPEIGKYKKETDEIILYQGDVYIVDFNLVKNLKSKGSFTNMSQINSIIPPLKKHAIELVKLLTSYVLKHFPNVERYTYYINLGRTGVFISTCFLNLKTDLFDELLNRLNSDVTDCFSKKNIQTYNQILNDHKSSIITMKKKFYFPYFKKDYRFAKKEIKIIKSVINDYNDKIFIHNLNRLVILSKKN